jgi:hypothetical protein
MNSFQPTGRKLSSRPALSAMAADVTKLLPK